MNCWLKLQSHNWEFTGKPGWYKCSKCNETKHEWPPWG